MKSYINPILIVDDEEYNLDIINEYLKDDQYQTIIARNGLEAIDIIKKNPNIEIIILDRMMLKMDGIQFLYSLKDVSKKEYNIIMQTAASSSSEVKEGIEAGVYYYLTKPYEKEILLSLVKSAINDYLIKKEMLEFSSDNNLIFNELLKEGVFHVKTHDHGKILAKIIANTCPNREEAFFGIQELIINGIEHGNLEINYDEKKNLLLKNKFHEEIIKRSKKFIDRYLVVRYCINAKELKISVKDQGKGFNWKEYLNINQERLTDPNGRGIVMAKMLSFSSLHYNDTGNEVTGIINRASCNRGQ